MLTTLLTIIAGFFIITNIVPFILAVMFGIYCLIKETIYDR